MHHSESGLTLKDLAAGNLGNRLVGSIHPID